MIKNPRWQWRENREEKTDHLNSNLRKTGSKESHKHITSHLWKEDSYFFAFEITLCAEQQIVKLHKGCTTVHNDFLILPLLSSERCICPCMLDLYQVNTDVLSKWNRCSYQSNKDKWHSLFSSCCFFNWQRCISTPGGNIILNHLDSKNKPKYTLMF